MATAGRTKINKDIEKGHFGPIPGIEVGQSWEYRIQLSENGVHAPPGEIFVTICNGDINDMSLKHILIFFTFFSVAGISGNKEKGCNSLVLAGGYKDDKDTGYEFTYTGNPYIFYQICLCFLM